MLEDGRITYRQLMMLIIISRLIITITYLPAVVSPPENQDVWISELLSFPFLLVFALPAYVLAQRFRHRSIIQCAEVILGKGGKVIGILYTWFLLHMASLTLRQSGEFLTAIPYPETPILVFMISIVVFSAYIVRHGLEVIGRLGEILTPVVLIGIFSAVVLVAGEIKLESLTPVFEKGILPVVHGASAIAARTWEILLISMLLPYLNTLNRAKRAVVLGFLTFVLFLILVTVPFHAIFGVELAKRVTFPFFSLVRLISIGEFLERLDAVHIGIWVFGVIVKVAIHYYMAVLGIAQLLGLQEYRPIVLPIGAIMVSLAVLQAESLPELRVFTSSNVFAWYTFFFAVVLPGLLLILALVRRKGSEPV